MRGRAELPSGVTSQLMAAMDKDHRDNSDILDNGAQAAGGRRRVKSAYNVSNYTAMAALNTVKHLESQALVLG